MVVPCTRNGMTLRDIILYSRDTLTIDELYETLYSKEKMKQLVIESKAEADGLVGCKRNLGKEQV